MMFPTLALELAYPYLEFKDALMITIKESSNPGHESLSTQLETLIIAPPMPLTSAELPPPATKPKCIGRSFIFLSISFALSAERL